MFGFLERSGIFEVMKSLFWSEGGTLHGRILINMPFWSAEICHSYDRRISRVNVAFRNSSSTKLVGDHCY